MRRRVVFLICDVAINKAAEAEQLEVIGEWLVSHR